ncbi:MAG: TldD/PmbA family protein [Bacillota bacterium]
MNLREFADRLFRRGQAEGFGPMEVYVQSTGQLSVRVFQDQLDSYSLAESRGLSFRGLYRDKLGYAFTEKLDQESIELLVAEAKSNAGHVESEDVEEIHRGSPSYPELDLESPEVARLTGARLIELAQETAALARDADGRVKFVNSGLSRTSTERVIINTHGLDLTARGHYLTGGVDVVAVDGSERRSGREFWGGRQLARLEPGVLAATAVAEAVSMFGASPVESGTYPVLLRWDVAADLLATFSGVFSAESVHKGLSLLKDRLGTQVAHEIVTLADDPFLPQGAGSTPFDAEGVATSPREIISAGTLATYLHNLKTARKDGVASTGHAFRSSFKSTVEVAPHNLFVSAGGHSFDQLVAGMEQGLLITSVQGLHSGAKPVSGDFSVGATGYLIQRGVVAAPVDQVTVAGNFFRMLLDVEAVGSDLNFRWSYGSPALRIRALAVAGK